MKRQQAEVEATQHLVDQRLEQAKRPAGPEPPWITALRESQKGPVMFVFEELHR